MNSDYGPQLSDTRGILVVWGEYGWTSYRNGEEVSAVNSSKESALESVLPTYAWPGGYPIFYILPDGGELCPQCIQRFFLEDDWSDTETVRTNRAVADIHYEGPSIYCDHCNREIESAYGDPDAEEDTDD